MDRSRPSLPLRLAFNAPQAGGRVHAPPRRSERRPAPGTLTALVVGALVWLLLGCSGLVWVIAFTSDTHSLMLALAVWVLAFVGPSLCATSLAYRLDPDDTPDAATRSRDRRSP